MSARAVLVMVLVLVATSGATERHRLPSAELFSGCWMFRGLGATDHILFGPRERAVIPGRAPLRIGRTRTGWPVAAWSDPPYAYVGFVAAHEQLPFCLLYRAERMTRSRAWGTAVLALLEPDGTCETIVTAGAFRARRITGRRCVPR